MGTIFGAIQNLVISHIRRRGFAYPRLLLVLDEANNVNLCTEREARAMAECQKMGLDIHVLVQLLDFPSAAVTNGVLSNCVRHEWFWNANPAVISKAVEDLGLRGEAGTDASRFIRQLSVGERWVKERTKSEKVWREKVKMLPNPWGFGHLAAVKTNKALSRVRQRPEYQRPNEQASDGTNEAAVVTKTRPLTALERLKERQQDHDSEP